GAFDGHDGGTWIDSACHRTQLQLLLTDYGFRSTHLPWRRQRSVLGTAGVDDYFRTHLRDSTDAGDGTRDVLSCKTNQVQTSRSQESQTRTAISFINERRYDGAAFFMFLS